MKILIHFFAGPALLKFWRAKSIQHLAHFLTTSPERIKISTTTMRLTFFGPLTTKFSVSFQPT